MKNWGIFINKSLGANQGGPSGYLYNLKAGLDKINSEVKIFSFPKYENNYKEKHNKKRKNIIMVFYYDFRLALSYIFKGIKIKSDISQEMLEMNYLHVHSCEDLFALKKIIGFKGKVIFTPHRPEAFYEEVISAQKNNFITKYKFPILKMVCKYMEIYSYKHADAYIFPCESAKNIYNNFPGFLKWSKNKKIEYVYTGANDLRERAIKGKYRKKINIKENDKLISFIGRHNRIKGYDILVKSADWLEDKEIYTMCAGTILDDNYPKNKFWYELNYVNDVYNIINDSDLVIIPNRNTYFDLIIIEILSLGGIVITSDTGGNIDIAKKTEGTMIFKSGNVESMIEKIDEYYNMSEEKIKKLKYSNREFYDKYCSLEVFGKNYIKAIERIIN